MAHIQQQNVNEYVNNGLETRSNIRVVDSMENSKRSIQVIFWAIFS